MRSASTIAAFSGHKMLGPNGIGVLYGRQRAAECDAAVHHRRLDDRDRHDGGDHLRARAAAVRGGHADDVAGRRAGRRRAVSAGRSAWTPSRRTRPSWWPPRWRGCRGIDGVRIIGPTSLEDRGSPVAFVVDGVHAHDVGQVLDDDGVAVRVGHHCAWPLHRRFGIAATARASFAVYNTSTRSTGWWPACGTRSNSSAGTDSAAGADLPGSDPRSLQAPAPPRAA